MAHLPTDEARKTPGRTNRLAARNQASPWATQVAAAEPLLAEVDGLPDDQHVKRVGEADIQAALETSATGRMLAD